MSYRRAFGLPHDPTTRRLVVALSATTLLLWVGASAILPLLPSYLRRTGSTPALVGIVMASYYAASVLTQYPVGRLSDRIGRRSVVAGGLVLFAIGAVGFSLVSEAGLAILFRGLQGVGAGAVTVASAATIGAVVAVEERGASYGALYGSQMLALAVGPLVGSIVGASSMPILFLGAAGFALLALTPVLSVLRADSGRVVHRDEPGVPGSVTLGALPAALGQERAVLRKSGAVIGVLGVFAGSGLLVGVYETCWTLLLRLSHATSFDVGLSWTLFSLPFALLAVPAGRVAGKVDRKRLALFALASSALFCALYPLLHVVALLVGLGVVEAAGAVFCTPPALLILSEAVPSTAQGAAQGAVETARTATTALAAAASGALFGLDAKIPFELCAGLVLLATVPIAFAWRSVPARSPAGRAARGFDLLLVERGAGAPESPSRHPGRGSNNETYRRARDDGLSTR